MGGQSQQDARSSGDDLRVKEIEMRRGRRAAQLGRPPPIELGTVIEPTRAGTRFRPNLAAQTLDGTVVSTG